MSQGEDIRSGRKAYSTMRWAEAHARLSTADGLERLKAADIERLGNAAYLVGRDEEAVRVWTRAHNFYVDDADVGHAVRVGFLLSLTSLLRGEMSQGNGWLARIQRLLETATGYPAEQGLSRLLMAIRQMFGGDPDGALPSFDAAVAVGTQERDPDLLALALLCRGQALVATGRAPEGAASLDEAMVSVTGGQVSPILSGIIYCAVILTCQSLFDSERSREWTAVFDDWCGGQPDLVPFRGQCLIHRSEILQMKGDWSGAMTAADRACHWLADRTEATVGRAYYQKGEMHRLLGDCDAAEACYERALRQGVNPQPGRALLRLAKGQAEAALATIRTACGSRYGAPAVPGDPERLKLLGPSVEICLAAGETGTAVAAAEELSGWASALGTPLVQATSAHATGAVLASTGDRDAALAEFSGALALWQRLAIPYEAARTRARLTGLYHDLGDDDSAEAHRRIAEATFSDLGASHDLSGVVRTLRGGTSCGLTCRHIDVLRLLADGRTNREIAAELGISRHTVARHMSNIFDKTGVSSRAAAVAFAHKNRLLS
ncbi:LuxR C-terminal-related transcriptional regulator [Defluviimonas sp. WL0024]|uniref:LuxR C-terminal-related transcriptional regulator n=1 Tax=Albidovulum salinarum TaxID=2984153 RepID=A0ABT2X5N5_9RHOB|nr:LuxR C-terminal-related transcriptional regulator [Defluviimonas sp. WL0024]MCU9849256.1 LuxR C-terminal-related transcriptional regulator [Defluviimonas sp. WL0024]